MSKQRTMIGKDLVNGAMGNVIIKQNGQSYNLMQTVRVVMRSEKQKEQYAVLGQPQKETKTTSLENTGDIEFYQGSDLFATNILTLQDDLVDEDFDMILINDDKNSAVGRREILFKDCNLDSTIMGQIDVEEGALIDSTSLTWRSAELIEPFNILEGFKRN